MATVIIGGGIIGLSTAFYLSSTPSSTRPSDIHIIEASPQLFASASGYAGGFLARDWHGGATASLGRLSFDLHRQLAEAHDGAARWGYSKCTSTSYDEGKGSGKRGDDWLRTGGSRSEVVTDAERAEKKGTAPAWLSQRQGGTLEVIGEESETAQVDPLRLCQFLLERCLERGVKLHQPATALKVNLDASGVLESIVVRSSKERAEAVTIPCARIVIAAGAWTPRVFKQLFRKSNLSLPVSSMAGHSIVLRSPRWKVGDETVGCHSVFSTDEDGFCPEMFSRLGGEIYLAGLNDSSVPLPDLVTDRKIDRECIKSLLKTARRLLGRVGEGGQVGDNLGDVEVIREGLCWRPITTKGTPIVGKVEDKKLGGGTLTRGDGGVWIATGHGPWGISNSLGTGKVMAEMLERRQTSCDVSGLGVYAEAVRDSKL